MTDLENHSQGIWRTFIIYSNKNLLKILEWLTINKVPHSFQQYSPTNDEPAHTSLRLEFSNIHTLELFRNYLQEELKEITLERSWDEPQWVKRAYEYGTRIWELLKTYSIETLGVDEDTFLRVAFHGLFNDLKYGYSDEAQFYLKALNFIMPYALKPGWRQE